MTERQRPHILIVGGEDHKTGRANDPDQRFERLDKWARDRFPEIQAIEYRWSGQLMETLDLALECARAQSGRVLQAEVEQ